MCATNIRKICLLLVFLLLPVIALANSPRTKDGVSKFIENNPNADTVSVVLPPGAPTSFPLGSESNTSIDAITEIITASDNSDKTITLIAFLDNQELGSAIFLKGTGGGIGNSSDNATLAQRLFCVKSAKTWANELSNQHENAWIEVFNTVGNPCYRASVGTDVIEGRVRQGDPLYVGIIGSPETVANYNIEYSSCDLQPVAPVFEDTIPSISRFSQESGDEQLVLLKFPYRECFNSSITINIKNKNGETVASDEIKQYGRFRGSFQLGAVDTKPTDQAFSKFDFGDGEGDVIKSSTTNRSGPEYVGSVVIYGFPHYVASLFGKRRFYPGRDLVNDNDPYDRIGLVLSVGLNDPKDTFGVGLSFELVPGINITASRIFQRVTVLDGVTVGDSFSGDVIPTKSDWNRDYVLGLSIDARYIAKFFSSAPESN